MFYRIHRSPEGGESAGTAVAEEATSQSPDIDVAEGAQPDTKPGTQASAPVNKAKVLSDLLKKKPGYQATEAELDVFDEFTQGKLKPEGDDEPEESDLKESPETAEKPKAAPVLSDLMKEVGAKSESEALEKVRELKRFTGSRDAQAYKALEQKHQSLERDSKAEMALWKDLAAGSPKAIQYLESQLLAAKGRAGIPAQQAGPKPFIDPSKFAVPEEAEALNSALGEHFGTLKSTIEKQAEIIRRLEESDNKRSTEHQMTQAQAKQLDEFVDVAAQIPDLKTVAGLRDKVSQWIGDPNAQIPELQVLDEVMSIANKEQIPLRVAWKVLEADRLRGQIAGAEDRGVRKAFNHKPNPSLSDMQGRAGATYTNYTDSQLKAMAAGRIEIPAEWFDKSDNLDKSKMPKRAVDLLLANEEGD